MQEHQQENGRSVDETVIDGSQEGGGRDVPSSDKECKKNQNDCEANDSLLEDPEEEEGDDDTDYTPDFIAKILEDPPILPNESKDDFLGLFESFEFDYKQRPKTDFEYLLTMNATKAAWELMRHDRMKVAILAKERRGAVDSLHRRAGPDQLAQSERDRGKRPPRNGGLAYFTDPDYRREFNLRLEREGFGSSAVEAEAFSRALHSLSTIDRLIKSAEKRLADCLRRLDEAYRARDPEQSMPRSTAASRADKMRMR